MDLPQRRCPQSWHHETKLSGHSMRAGFVTSALDSRVDALKIMGITLHAKVDTLKIYDRRESGFDDHAGGSFFKGDQGAAGRPALS